MSPIPWEPDVLARIRHLALVARMAVRGVIQGAHPSRAVGQGLEFVDYKAYTAGDPLRDIDWRVLARSDRLLVRRYRAESNLPALVVLDASADMATGRGGLTDTRDGSVLDGTKYGYGVCLAATLSWFLYLHGEPMGLSILGGAEPGRYLPPRGGRRQLARVLAALARSRPAGRAHIGKNLARVARQVRRSSLLVLVSDLMEDVAGWAPAMDALGRRRSDLRVVHLYDPAEMELRFSHPRMFFSPEGGDAMPLDPLAAQGPFKEVVRGYRDEIRAVMARQRAVYLAAGSDRPLAEVLGRLVSAHAGRARVA